MNATRHDIIKQRLSLILFTIAPLMITACAGVTDRSEDGLRTLISPGLTFVDPAWQRLLKDGDAAGASAAFEAEGAQKTPEAQAWRRFGQCEADNVAGLYTRAAKACVEAIRIAPSRPVANWALIRLLDLRPLILDFTNTITPALDAITQASKADPSTQTAVMTRYLSHRLRLNILYNAWYRSDETGPFRADSVGVPTIWTTVGPTSLNANLDIGDSTAPELDSALAESYELLDFKRLTKKIQTNSFQVTPEYPLSGIYVAESWVKIDREGRFDVALDAQSSAVLMIDGERILFKDDSASFASNERVARDVELSAGVHRILVRFTYEPNYKTSFGVMLLPQQLDTSMTFSDSRPSGAVGEVESAGEPSPWIGEAVNVGALKGTLPLYLTAMMATEFVEESHARAALDALKEAGVDGPAVQLTRADLFGRLWSVPSAIRNRERIKAFRAAHSADKNAGRPLLKLAAELQSQGLKNDTGTAIEALIEARPDELSTWRQAASYYKWRGFLSKAEDALQKATKIDSNSCAVAQQLGELLAQRSDALSDAETLEPWLQCDLFQWRRARDRRLIDGDGATYLRALIKDTTRYPYRRWTWSILANFTLETSGEAAAIKVIEEALQYLPGDQSLNLTRAQLMLRVGRVDNAKQVLASALSQNQSSYDLHRTRSMLDGQLPLQDLIADGIGAIKDYEADPVTFPSDAVYVLDYMARRYFEEGSSADVTHLVIKVQSKAGLNKYGEVRFPRGAIPLMVRTIKRGGYVVEPVRESNKPVVSMPSLDVGDYIEYAYLTFNGRNPVRRAASVGARFYFQMAEIASARSEFIVEVPESWEPEFELRNDPPVMETSLQDGYKRFRFIQKKSSQPRPEPMSVKNPEHLPYVQLLHRYTWGDAHQTYKNNFALARASSALIRERAEALSRDLQSDLAKVKAVWNFVNSKVKSPRSGDFTTDAAHIEASGAGNPIVLMHTLLNELEIPSEVFLVRSSLQDPFEGIIPGIGLYGFSALRVTLDDDTIWLNPSGRNARFNYLPPSVQNAPAISINPDADLDRVTTPLWGDDLEQRDITIDINLDASGDAAGVIVETLRGQDAIARRNFLDEQGSVDKIQKYFERKVNYDFNGSQLESYTIDGRDDPDRALVLTYKFIRSGYARKEQTALIIEDRYALRDLTRSFARLSDRTVPMLLQYTINDQVTINLKVPEGMTISGPGNVDDLTYGSIFGDYQRVVSRHNNTITINHTLYLPIQRINPKYYPEFASWAGDVDRATYKRLEVSRGPEP